jgi:hypothetical protein
LSRVKHFALLLGVVSSLAGATPARAEGPATAPANSMVFPGSIRDAFRLRLTTFVAPSASFDEGGDLTLVRPQLRLRVRAPLGTRATAQLAASFATSFYDLEGDDAPFFEDCAACTVPDELYAATLALELGFLLNESRHVFRAGERWAVLVGGMGRARWESGAFDDSMTGQGSLAIGYELPARLRLALGARVENSIEDGDLSVGPVIELRWDVNQWVRLRTRDVGLQLELRPTDAWKLFLAGYRESDRFRLDSRAGAPSDLSFRDRQVLVGVGAEWRKWRWLRIAAEAGAIVSRSVAVSTEDDGKLDSVGGDPSAYFELRLELRP